MHRGACQRPLITPRHRTSIYLTNVCFVHMAFIGRERELAALGGALQRASDGEPTRVCISGPLGIGTSRLIDELSERLGKSNGVAFVRARCFAPMSGVPYGPLRHAFSHALDAIADDRLEQLLGSAAHD